MNIYHLASAVCACAFCCMFAGHSVEAVHTHATAGSAISDQTVIVREDDSHNGTVAKSTAGTANRCGSQRNKRWFPAELGSASNFGHSVVSVLPNRRDCGHAGTPSRKTAFRYACWRRTQDHESCAVWIGCGFGIGQQTETTAGRVRFVAPGTDNERQSIALCRLCSGNWPGGEQHDETKR